jgi:hypothetical protein
VQRRHEVCPRRLSPQVAHSRGRQPDLLPLIGRCNVLSLQEHLQVGLQIEGRPTREALQVVIGAPVRLSSRCNEARDGSAPLQYKVPAVL